LVYNYYEGTDCFLLEYFILVCYNTFRNGSSGVYLELWERKIGMERNQIPRPGEIYNHFKDKPYQIITVATHTETGESMVVYQALYGDFKTYVRPLSMFMSEVDKEKYPESKQTYRFELRNAEKKVSEVNSVPTGDVTQELVKPQEQSVKQEQVSERTDEGKPADSIKKEETPSGDVNSILINFLDAPSYTRKLEILTSNTKHMTNRLINDMAVSIDCTVEEGPLEERIQGLIYCLQAMRRFEDRRLR